MPLSILMQSYPKFYILWMGWTEDV